jgi:hypothetical protein
MLEIEAEEGRMQGVDATQREKGGRWLFLDGERQCEEWDNVISKTFGWVGYCP